jgi:hypothetical protein
MAEPVTLENAVRLSHSKLWDIQRRYFEHTGPAAWATSEVPHYVTTNAFLARAYARVYAAYFDDAMASGGAHPLGTIDPAEPFRVIELGAGHGRLGFLLARELADLGRARGVKFQVVLTDFTEANVSWWLGHPDLRPLLDAGVADVALFDADNPGPLRLRVSGQVLEPGSVHNPMGVVSNYVVDTLRQDAFVFQEGRIQEIQVQAALPAGSAMSADDPEASKEVLLLHKRVPATLPVYHDPVLDGILERYRDGLQNSEVLVPVGAIRAVRYLLRVAGGRLCVLAGDKAYRKQADLEGRQIGDLVKHGSFSMMANFDGVAQALAPFGGVSLHHTNRYTRFTVSVLAATGPEGSRAHGLGRTREAFETWIDTFGPAEYHRLYKLWKEEMGAEPSLPLILLFIRLSGFDPSAFTRFSDRILDLVPAAGKAVQDDVAACLDRVVERTYVLNPKDDVRFSAARVYFRLGRFADAGVQFERVTRDSPDRKTGWFNLGLCQESLGRPDEARRSWQRALELDPKYSRAREALDRLSG